MMIEDKLLRFEFLLNGEDVADEGVGVDGCNVDGSRGVELGGEVADGTVFDTLRVVGGVTVEGA